MKPETTDPDFSDIPLGGWVGTVREIDSRTEPPLYLIRWNECILYQMHPVYRDRCERDGLDCENMCLSEDDIEPDTGDSVPIEQPTKIVTRPLNAKDQDDRVRMALGLTSDDLLSDVEDETLLAYSRHLETQFSFPEEAIWEPECGPKQPVKIIGIADPEEDWMDETYGLICQAKSEGRLIELPLAECQLKGGGPNSQVLEDYKYWFWNFR